jgi:hypothetical protein
VSSLKNKKILFIGIGFYDYEQFIKAELIKQGAEVSYFTERGATRFAGLKEKWYKFWGLDQKILYKNHQNDILESINGKKFDYVFVIKGGLLELRFIESLKMKYPSTKFIMYQWDSLNRVDGVHNIIGYFDRVLSFDPKDCAENPNLIFRPLFHREKVIDDNCTANSLYDISFIGWLHNDRLQFINAFVENLKNNRKCYVFLYTGVYTYIRHLLKSNVKYLSFKTMKYTKCRSIMLNSNCVLDLPHGLQTGLTMRAVESVGFQKKLITTSKGIVNYDFYCKANVFILNENYNKSELELFINSPYHVLHNDIYKRYQVKSWLNDIFE